VADGEVLTYFNLQRYLNRHYLKVDKPGGRVSTFRKVVKTLLKKKSVQKIKHFGPFKIYHTNLYKFWFDCVAQRCDSQIDCVAAGSILQIAQLVERGIVANSAI
jgi:hypothetical protein